MDNLPNTGLEALVSGIPVIAFKIGGLSDIVTDKYNGRLIEAFDTIEMAEGIKWLLEDNARYQKISFHARTSALEQFSNKLITEAHINVYENILEKEK